MDRKKPCLRYRLRPLRAVGSTSGSRREGFHRKSNKDFMKFLDYSRSSIAETVSHCYVALDQDCINKTEMAAVKDQTDIVWKKVNNFITYLDKIVKKGVKKIRSGYNHNQ